jgi:hypothetical protein
MEFYLAIMKNKIMSFAGKWMELEIIMLNKINQSHKDTHGMFSLICGICGREKKDMKVRELSGIQRESRGGGMRKDNRVQI